MRRDFLVQALVIAAAYSLLLAVADVVSGGRMTARMQVSLVAAILFNFGAACSIALMLSKWHHLSDNPLESSCPWSVGRDAGRASAGVTLPTAVRSCDSAVRYDHCQRRRWWNSGVCRLD